MKTILVLMRREVWENRSLWIAPLSFAAVLLLLSMFGGVHLNNGDNFFFGASDVPELSAEDRRQRLQSVTPPEHVRKSVIAGTLSALTMIQFMVLGIVVFFYLLDSLLSERRDRSILFWKSLPISDTQVVVSKLLTAMVLAPVFVLGLSAVVQVLFSGVAAVRFDGLPFSTWDTMIWLKIQAVFLAFVPMVLIWYLPLAGYLLLVSAWARKNAFLWAVLPWAAVLLVEGMILHSGNTARFLGERFFGFAKVMGIRDGDDFDGNNVIGEAYAAIGKVFLSYEIWLGLVAGIALIYAAIRIRRYRDDS